MIVIDRKWYLDCLEALQRMEDDALDVPVAIRSKRWTVARKRLVLALVNSAEREFAEEMPAFLRPQAE